jgi:hypothetical protein
VLGLGTGHAADLAAPYDRDELIAYGPLLSDNGVTWLGTAALVRAPDPETARSILTPDRYADIEVDTWQFAVGRRDLGLCRIAPDHTWPCTERRRRGAPDLRYYAPNQSDATRGLASRSPRPAPR